MGGAHPFLKPCIVQYFLLLLSLLSSFLWDAPPTERPAVLSEENPESTPGFYIIAIIIIIVIIYFSFRNMTSYPRPQVIHWVGL